MDELLGKGGHDLRARQRVQLQDGDPAAESTDPTVVFQDCVIVPGCDCIHPHSLPSLKVVLIVGKLTPISKDDVRDVEEAAFLRDDQGDGGRPVLPFSIIRLSCLQPLPNASARPAARR